MKRRINNLHKGLFKLNKSSNIIELHSKKNNQEKDNEREKDKEKEKENININQYRYFNNEENNVKKSKNISKYEKQNNKRKSSLNKEKEINIYENTFSDLDSSNKKSIINSKIYGNYIKNGKYFTKLRQQVIDKFISGKPLISIDLMYNNPEVKRMFGVITNTERTNYRSDCSNNINENNNINSSNGENEIERDRRIPPSKILPLMMNNNENILPLQFNENIKNVNIGQNPLLNNFVENKNINSNENNFGVNINLNENTNNFNSIKGMGNLDEINQIDFNTMNKIKPFYLDLHNNDQNPNPLFIPLMYNNPQKSNILGAKNNFQTLNNNNEINSLNDRYNNMNKPPFDLYEFNYQDIFNNNNRVRRKRKAEDSQNINNSLVQFNGINEPMNNKQNNFYQNIDPEFQEQEQINELINNIKRANDKNFNVFSNLRNDNSYFNNLITKNDMGHNFINSNLDRNDSDIGFGIHSKNHF